LVREFTLFGNGQFPWGREEVYTLEKDELFLAGTAEVPVTAYFADEVLMPSDLPQKFRCLFPLFSS
jgi:seryl-tRNA synthetase